MNRLLLSCCVIGCLLAGCASNRAGPYQSTASDRRDVARAEQLYQDAKPILTSDAAKAESLLREALSCDLYHGGAHNNLGVLLLNQDKLYDAAEEFEWARKLLPGNPEPRVNLALTLDRAGRSGDALEATKTALEVLPGNLPALQLLALLQIRDNCPDGTTAATLQQLSMRCSDPAWRSWAVEQRDKLASRPQ
jgi:Tfp pilus assembly protein PilF